MPSRDVLTVEGMTLRPWLPQDLGALASLAEVEATRRALYLPGSPTQDDLADALEELMSEPEIFAVVPEGSEQPVGGIALRLGGLSGLDIDEDEALAEAWGDAQSLETALPAVMGYGFSELGLTAVWTTESGRDVRHPREEWEKDARPRTSSTDSDQTIPLVERTIVSLGADCRESVRDSHATLVLAPGGSQTWLASLDVLKLAAAYGRPALAISGEDELARARAWLLGVGRGLTLHLVGPQDEKSQALLAKIGEQLSS